MLNLALHPVVIGALLVVFVIVSVMMILIVLIQRPQGGGLSEAFGSNSGSGHTAFGAKTGDALTTATIGIFVLFLLTAVGLNYAVRPPKDFVVQPAAQETPSPVPASSEAPATTTEEVDLKLGTDGMLESPADDATQPASGTEEQPAQSDQPQAEEPKPAEPSSTDPGSR